VHTVIGKMAVNKTIMSKMSLATKLLANQEANPDGPPAALTGAAADALAFRRILLGAGHAPTKIGRRRATA
jgi:hypothetical protein